MNARITWCLGMYGSASTWLYNVVREIYEVADQRNVRLQFVSDRLDETWLGQPNTISLIKSHEITNDCALVTIAGRADQIFVSLRDPRDSVASLMVYHHYKFDKALKLVEAAANLWLGYTKDRRAVCVWYETGFFNNVDTVRLIADKRGYALRDAEANKIFDNLSRAAVERYIQQLPNRRGVLRDHISGDLLDPKTQWHTHHAGRSGVTGSWRNALSATEAAEVTSHFELSMSNHPVSA